MRTAAKIIAAGVSTLALAGGIGAGIAYADPPSPTPTPSASASPTATTPPKDADRREDGKKKRRALLATALHGEVTLAGEKHRVVVFQRGPVQRVSETALTVKSADGYTATYVLNPETKVRRNQAKATIGDLRTGDRAFVVATKDGSTLKAFRIKAIDG